MSIQGLFCDNRNGISLTSSVDLKIKTPFCKLTRFPSVPTSTSRSNNSKATQITILRQIVTNMTPPKARLTLNEATRLVADDGLDALKLLGVGEGGDAWLCSQTEAPYDLRVAKILPTPAKADKEYQMSHILDHPAILKPISHPPGSRHIVMPYIPGGGLDAFRRQLNNELKVKVPPAFVYHVLLKLMAGLRAMHTYTNSNGQLTPICHLDLVCQNVLVSCLETDQNGLPAIKIIDFGRANWETTARNAAKSPGKELPIDFDLRLLGETLHSLAHNVSHGQSRDSAGNCRNLPQCPALKEGDNVHAEFRSIQFQALMGDLSWNGSKAMDIVQLENKWRVWAERQLAQALSQGVPEEIGEALKTWAEDRYAKEMIKSS